MQIVQHGEAGKENNGNATVKLACIKQYCEYLYYVTVVSQSVTPPRRGTVNSLGQLGKVADV